MSGVTQFRRKPLPVQSYEPLSRLPQEESSGEEEQWKAQQQFHQTEPVFPPGNEPATTSRRGPRRGLFGHIGAWTKEIVWCIVSVILVVVLVITLAQYDNKELPKWKMGLTLNTVIAIIATVCRSAMVVPVAEGLSQLKWNWFVTQERPLKDIRTFDQASRGPWSAIALIGKMRGRFISLSSLASVILITGLVTSFLTQSAVSYESRELSTNDTKVTAYKTKAFGPTENIKSFDFQLVTDEMIRAAFKASLNTLSEKSADADPICTSSKCQWPRFSTLAICASVGNITEHLTEKDDTDTMSTVASLPHGYGFYNQDFNGHILMNITSNSDRDPKNSLFKWENPDLVRVGILNHFVVYALPNGVDNDNGESVFQAAEVLWHFCVKTYETSFSDGVPQYSVTSPPVKVTKQEDRDFTLVDGTGEEFHASRSEVNNALFVGLSMMFRGIYNAERPYVANNAGQDAGTTGNDYVQQLGTNMFDSLVHLDPKDMGGPAVPSLEGEQKIFKALQQSVDNIALAMTTNMRKSNISEHIPGQVLTEKTFVVVRWEWLSFLAAQVGLTIIFLIAVIIYTARLHIDVIKSSNIAELLAIRNSAKDIDSGGADILGSGLRREIGDEFLARLQKDGPMWHLEVSQRTVRDDKS